MSGGGPPATDELVKSVKATGDGPEDAFRFPEHAVKIVRRDSTKLFWTARPAGRVRLDPDRGPLRFRARSRSRRWPPPNTPSPATDVAVLRPRTLLSRVNEPFAIRLSANPPQIVRGEREPVKAD